MAARSSTRRAPAAPAPITLVVFAPLGNDERLSRHPDPRRVLPLASHPMVGHLKAVARLGVNVIALIDHTDHATWLLEIPAGGHAEPSWASAWRQDMAAPATLAGLLVRARTRWPQSMLVLSVEGHGAGFWPELDLRQFTPERLTGGGAFSWRLSPHMASLEGTPPPLTMGAPMLTMGAPMLPGTTGLLSTPGLDRALREGLAALPASGLPAARLEVVHLNNCHNLALEVMLAVAPHARWAVGYANYNFYTAGEGCLAAFTAWLRAAPAARTPQALAAAFAEGNRKALAPPNRCPTLGGVVDCAQVAALGRDTEVLGRALSEWLRSGTLPASREQRVAAVRNALVAAQQYDTRSAGGEGALETPDELTDLLSLCQALMSTADIPASVRTAALRLGRQMEGIKAYGDTGAPWCWPERRWDFSSRQLALSIFCPDPLREGLWDWRSPYYLVPREAPGRPPLQPLRLAWLGRPNGWVDFIVEYHRDTPFVGVRAAPALFYPARQQ